MEEWDDVMVAASSSAFHSSLASFSTAKISIKGSVVLVPTSYSHWCPGLRGPSLRLELHPQLHCQSCLRFLVFVGLIVFGGSNMIVKAWHGALDFHKHVLFLFILCALSYIRFLEKYRRMLKKSMTVVPIDEKED